MIEKKIFGFNKALESLKFKGFFFDGFEQINSGVNSNCWKLYNKNERYFLKSYKSFFSDKRDRFNTELNFLNVLKKENFEKVPRVLFSDQKEGWALLSWIEGEKIEKPNRDHWKQYLDFIIDLQKLKCSRYLNQINNASEACFTIESHYTLIENRFSLFLSYITEKKLFNNLFNWLNDEIFGRLKLLKKVILQNKSLISLEKIQKIISPSDVGFHNVIYKSDQLYFFDFEYAGWDDVYKLFVDLLIRPDNIIQQETALEIVEYLSQGMEIIFEEKIFKIYLELYRIKWILIILNRVSKKEINSENDFSEIFTKVINYYKEVGNMWKLNNQSIKSLIN